MAPAARRTGKTELAKRKLVETVLADRKRNDGFSTHRYFAAAPTRAQAKEIFWADLKALTPKQWLIEDPRESELKLTTKWGTELMVLGLDKAARVEGVSWDGCVVDEIANCRPGIWHAHIRPALADRKGWAWLLGVPDADAPGQIDYKDLYDYASSGKDDDWGIYTWPTADIVDPAEVEAMRQTMDEETFRQEMLGHFILAGGVAFPMFDSAKHVREVKYDPALPLCWALDFNVQPMCSGVIQYHHGHVRVLDEIVIRQDTQTSVAVEYFLEWCSKRDINPRNVRIYGDPSGGARDTTSGTSDWNIIRQALHNYEPVFRVPKRHAPLKDTLNSVRARLQNAAGEVNAAIDPHCRQLIKDLQTLLWPSDLSEGHCAAWFRYFCQQEFPVRGYNDGEIVGGTVIV
jgi:hypothetical protein